MLSRWKNAALLMSVAVALLIMLQPWFRPAAIQSFDFQRWVVVICLVALCILSFPYALVRLRREAVVFSLLLIVVALTMLSAWIAYGVNFLSISVLRGVLCVIAMVGLVGAWSGSSVLLRRVFSGALMVAVALYLIYTMLGAVSLVMSGVFDRTFLISGFSNVNHAAGFLLVTLLILPGLSASFDRTHGVQRLVYVFSAIIVFLLLLVGSRGAILAWLFVAGVLCSFRRHREVSLYLRWLLCTAIAGATLYILFRITLGLTGVGVFRSGKALVGDSGRLELYQRAWEGALASPWLGHGPLSYAAIPDFALGHAHNVMLTTLYEAGFPCTLLLLGLVAYVVRILWKGRLRIIASPAAISGVAVLLAFMAHSQFSGLPMIPATVLVVAVGGAFVASAWPSRPIIISHRWTLVGGLTGLTLGLCYLLMAMNYWQAVDETVHQKPRFWLQGGTETWLAPRDTQFKTR